MGNTWITDMRHYLDEAGRLSSMPNAALSIALFLGSIVEWMTSEPLANVHQTNVRCRRSPGHVRCIGRIQAGYEEHGEIIRWLCPICGDNGYIRGWQGTLWDRSVEIECPGGKDATDPA